MELTILLIGFWAGYLAAKIDTKIKDFLVKPSWTAFYFCCLSIMSIYFLAICIVKIITY